MPKADSMKDGYLAALFDFSFSSLITPKLISLFYVVAVGGMGIFTLFFIKSAFDKSSGLGLAALVLSPVVFLILMTLVRIYLEIVVVVFKIAEYAARIAHVAEA